MREVDDASPGITDCSDDFARFRRPVRAFSGSHLRRAAAFEHADWHAVQQAMKSRIHLYDHHVGLVVEQVRCITDGKSTDADFLLRVKSITPGYCRITRASRLRELF
ncbi:isocitrate dehydrogenase kinase/phosphatase AceK regulatory subunit [Shigella flexneri]